MKSIKDIKKEIGYVEFKSLFNSDSILIPIYYLRNTKNGIRVETKQHSIIDELIKYSNFHDETIYYLKGNPITYNIVKYKKTKQEFEFSELNYGFLTDLIVSKNIYRFTLTK